MNERPNLASILKGDKWRIANDGNITCHLSLNTYHLLIGCCFVVL